MHRRGSLCEACWCLQGERSSKASCPCAIGSCICSSGTLCRYWNCSEALHVSSVFVCRISAAAGQVILAMDPVISIALGYLVARNETHLGPLGIAGGATLLGACLLASFYAKKEH